MATPIVVEDGTIVAGANVYDTIANANAYHDARGNTVWAQAELKAREEAAIRGTDYLTRTYRERWKGIRIDQDQTLDWPRAGVLREDFFRPDTAPRPVLFPGLAFLVGEDEIPLEVKHAFYEAALRALSEDLIPDLERGGDIKSLKAGSAAVEYFQSASDTKEYRAIDLLVLPLLHSKPGQRGIVRG